MSHFSAQRRDKIFDGGAYRRRESVIGAFSAGFVFILFGVVYLLALPDNLFERVINFFGGMTTSQVGSSGVYLLAPIRPEAHGVVFTAFYQFCVGLVFLQFVVLVLRVFLNSPGSKMAESMGSLVFWSGTAWFAATFLGSSTTLSAWFAFWAGVLMMVGLSLVSRATVLLVKR